MEDPHTQSMGEPGFEVLEARVDEAQQALLAAARTTPDVWWDPQTLRAHAQNGFGGDVMMFALTDLVNKGQFELDEQLRVKLRAHS